MSKKDETSWSIKKVFKEVALFLLMLFTISMILNYMRQPEIRENIYAYNLVDIESKKVKFSGYKGKPLVVHFWATWCPTCKLEASNIESLSSSYNVVTIAVNSGTNEALKRYMEKKSLTYSVINDRDGKLAKKFDIGAYPTTLIFNSKGALSFAEVGYSTTLGLKARLEVIN